MKRNIVIVCVFAFLALALMATSCTCYTGDGGEIRGCGYECEACAEDNKGCGMACLDQLCPGENVYKDYVDSISVIGKKDVDYQSPTVTYDSSQNLWEFSFSVNILKIYEAPWTIKAELCFVQDGALVGRADISQTVQTTGNLVINQSPAFNKFYNEEGGEVTCIIDNFSITRTES